MTEHFRAWNTSRTKQHTITGNPAPIKISTWHWDDATWRNNARVTKLTKRPTRRSQRQRGLPPTIMEEIILRNPYQFACSACHEESEECDPLCFLGLQYDAADAIKTVEIRDTGTQIGYGVFVRPGKHIASGTQLGEYLGELLPLGEDCPLGNRYLFEWGTLTSGFIGWVDGAVYSNWTRFVNHSCDNNVQAERTVVGGRQTILFAALRDIGEGEELFIDYGKDYFTGMGIRCSCSYRPKPHWPVEVPLEYKMR